MSDILKKQKIEVIEGLEESAGCLRTESYDRYAEYVDEGIAEITRLREENKRLKAALEHLLSDIAKSEHVENWYPSPDKSRFWKSVVNAEKLLKESGDE